MIGNYIGCYSTVSHMNGKNRCQDKGRGNKEKRQREYYLVSVTQDLVYL